MPTPNHVIEACAGAERREAHHGAPRLPQPLVGGLDQRLERHARARLENRRGGQRRLGRFWPVAQPVDQRDERAIRAVDHDVQVARHHVERAAGPAPVDDLHRSHFFILMVVPLPRVDDELELVDDAPRARQPHAEALPVE